MNATVLDALTISQVLLTELAADAERFADLFGTAFGADYDRGVAESLRQAWAAEEFQQLPGLEVRSGAELNGALGVYAAATDTVYVSREFVETATADQIASVLLEELGHGVDARVNGSDSAGDEGEIFSALARGLELSEAQLDLLRQQDDSAEVVLDGQVLAVEQATLTVTTTADNTTSDAEVTLREAIIAANGDLTTDSGQTGSGADVITLGAGTFGLSEMGTGEDAAVTGDLDITSDITIRGAGAGVTIIDANQIDRVFEVLSGGKLTLENVTVTGGSGSFNGGGIRAVNAELAIANSTISGNSADLGGGIDVFLSELAIANSTISGNSAEYAGGGIFSNTSTFTIDNSTISGNVGVSGIAFGGGIYNFSSTATIRNSTVSGNSAGDDGGGIYNYSSTATVSNSTVSGNTAANDGGGIFNAGYSAATITSSIVGDNTAAGNPDLSNPGGSLVVSHSLVE
ncbi:MAG: right-handed parallel beta-helix repeat-containing protein, partial [Cyanobacteria bacterium J06648_11]